MHYFRHIWFEWERHRQLLRSHENSYVNRVIAAEYPYRNWGPPIALANFDRSLCLHASDDVLCRNEVLSAVGLQRETRAEGFTSCEAEHQHSAEDVRGDLCRGTRKYGG